MEGQKYLSFHFEVFGDVQGVGFRWSTKVKAESLGLRGWVQNSYDGTVSGIIQGREPYAREMERWLKEEGSRYSTITKMVKKDEKYID